MALDVNVVPFYSKHILSVINLDTSQARVPHSRFAAVNSNKQRVRCEAVE